MYFLCPFSEVRMNGWVLDVIPVSDFPQLDESSSVTHTGNVFSAEQKFAFLGRLGSFERWEVLFGNGGAPTKTMFPQQALMLKLLFLPVCGCACVWSFTFLFKCGRLLKCGRF